MSTDLMTKLALSKKIMDRHNEIPRSGNNGIPNSPSSPQLQSFDTPQASYNIPQDLMSETISTKPVAVENATPDRILNSKLPDEIKKLMIENPIDKPKMVQTSDFLSDDIIEGAQKLMGTKKPQINENTPQRQNQGQNVSGIDMNALKQMIRDTVRDTVRDVVREELQKSGIIVESENKTNDNLQLRVGKHIFEGKVTKIKKVQ
jgi:hypothetical protein